MHYMGLCELWINYLLNNVWLVQSYLPIIIIIIIIIIDTQKDFVVQWPICLPLQTQ